MGDIILDDYTYLVKADEKKYSRILLLPRHLCHVSWLVYISRRNRARPEPSAVLARFTASTPSSWICLILLQDSISEDLIFEESALVEPEPIFALRVASFYRDVSQYL